MLKTRLLPSLALFLTTALAQQPPRIPVERTSPLDTSVQVFGQKIRYLEAGAEHPQTLILVHGLGSDSGEWAANIGPLSQRYHVLAIDLIGFGQSEQPLIEYDIKTYTDFLSGFLRALKLPRATFVGNSFGGWIALRLAAES